MAQRYKVTDTVSMERMQKERDEKREQKEREKRERLRPANVPQMAHAVQPPHDAVLRGSENFRDNLLSVDSCQAGDPADPFFGHYPDTYDTSELLDDSFWAGIDWHPEVTYAEDEHNLKDADLGRSSTGRRLPDHSRENDKGLFPWPPWRKNC